MADVRRASPGVVEAGPLGLEPSDLEASAARELSALGKRIEHLRIQRGLSKQLLARRAGTSRQQLWRVMTGKSELTGSLCQRLATALQVDAVILRTAAADSAGELAAALASAGPFDAVPLTLAAYVADPANLLRTLATFPADDSGRQLKLGVVGRVETLAAEAGLPLPKQYATIRAELGASAS